MPSLPPRQAVFLSFDQILASSRNAGPDGSLDLGSAQAIVSVEPLALPLNQLRPT